MMRYWFLCVVVGLTLVGCATAGDGLTQRFVVNASEPNASCRLTRDGKVLASSRLDNAALVAMSGKEFKVTKSKSAITVECTEPKGGEFRKVVKAMPTGSATSVASHEYPVVTTATFGPDKPIITGKQIGCAIVGSVILGPGGAAGACS